MTHFRSLLLPFTLSLGCLSALAVPALREPRILLQPDGSQIEVLNIGDEHMHFLTTSDGHPLFLDADGFYKPADASRMERIIRSIPKMSAPQSGMGLTSTTYPRTGSPKGLIILAEFSDVKFVTPDASAYFHEMINGEDFSSYGATGSALKYFTDQSHGLFTPEFDVLGPVTLPETQAYYGGNDNYGRDLNPYRMITDAVQLLDPSVDFSRYDTDNDGVIDNVYLFYAGQGEADFGRPETVWPHSWDLRNEGIDMEFDGVKLAKYACSNEWAKDTPVGIGTFVHEFCHVLGLPDLYPTDSPARDYTPGKYSVLDQGPYNNSGKTPPNFSSYELNALGWFEPEVLDAPMSVTLAEISSGNFGLIPTGIPTEFFLIENRQLTGWDAFLPNHGMLVWHIDYDEEVFQGNTVNNLRQHPRVDIVKANGITTDPSGYTFPGTSRNDALTPSTYPALKTWGNEAVDLPLTGITERRGIVSFDVAGGAPRLAVPEPVVTGWSESERYFNVGWDKVEGATEYRLSVYTNDGSTLEQLETGFDNSELPAGWNASEATWNVTVGNYGEASPSFKFGKNSQILRSPVTESAISAIEFWAKGMGAEGSYLSIEGLAGDEWYHITDYTPAADAPGEYVTVSDNIRPATVQLRFKMVRKKGSILLDDLTVWYGDTGEAIPGFDKFITSDTDSVRINNLPFGRPHYYLTVTALNGDMASESHILYFELKGESEDASLHTIDESKEALTEYYNLQGIRLSKPYDGQLVIVKTPTGNKKSIYKY